MKLTRQVWFIGPVLVALLLIGGFILFQDKIGGVDRKRRLPQGYLVVACKRGAEAYFALAEADFNSYVPEDFRKTNTPFFADDIDGLAAVINKLPRGPELEQIVAIATKPKSSGDLSIRRLTHDEFNRLKKLLDDTGRTDVKLWGSELVDDASK